ncbi:SRPBCC domain-containing protein [Streptosporangium sp. NPDC050855]|uniref:SRPBCC domain-containing protein n=1 Tax=Streptosporangium sp. NPDC050855 TaxID=3366194 RepID=UPI00379A250F
MTRHMTADTTAGTATETAGRAFEVTWEGELPASPQEVWEAFTLHTTGWYWEIDYEPRVGGAERGLTGKGGVVSVWEPPRHFTTRTLPGADEFNELDHRLRPTPRGTLLTLTHRGVIAGDDYDAELDACRRHTALYYHSLGEYLRHFPGRDAAYLRLDAPGGSASGGFARLCRALGVPDGIEAGDPVTLTPAGLDPIEGVADFVAPAFLGVRSADALYRFHGRDAWGWPVGVAHHLFAEDADAEAARRAWATWLDDVFTSEREA